MRLEEFVKQKACALRDLLFDASQANAAAKSVLSGMQPILQGLIDGSIKLPYDISGWGPHFFRTEDFSNEIVRAFADLEIAALQSDMAGYEQVLRDMG